MPEKYNSMAKNEEKLNKVWKKKNLEWQNYNSFDPSIDKSSFH